MADLILEPYAVLQRWSVHKAEVQWNAVIGEYLNAVARRCEETGEVIIGHIKALALFLDGGYLMASVVSPSIPVGIEGSVPGDCTELVFTLNLIVYGLGRDSLARIARETATDLIDRWKGGVVIEAI